MKKAYIITATALLGAPLILAAAIKSVIPIIFWFLPVAAYLFLSHGKRMITAEKDGEAEKDENGENGGAKNAPDIIPENKRKARENGATDCPPAHYKEKSPGDAPGER